MIDWQEHRAVVQGGGAFTIKPASVASGHWRRWMWNQRLWYVTGGRARFRLRCGVIKLQPDTAMWLQPGFEYRFEEPPETPLEIYAWGFDLCPAGSHAAGDPQANLPERLAVPDPVYARAVLSRLDRLREDVPHMTQSVLRGLSRRRANRLLTELLIELEQATSPADAASTRTDPVDLAVLNLGRRIAVRPGGATSVGAMAAELGLGRDAFARRFEAIHRDKPQRFIVHQRIRLASQLLAETYQPIKQIAAQLGYRDTHYFSRQFKQWTGQTPHGFRCGEQRNPSTRSDSVNSPDPLPGHPQRPTRIPRQTLRASRPGS